MNERRNIRSLGEWWEQRQGQSRPAELDGSSGRTERGRLEGQWTDGLGLDRNRPGASRYTGRRPVPRQAKRPVPHRAERRFTRCR